MMIINRSLPVATAAPGPVQEVVQEQPLSARAVTDDNGRRKNKMVARFAGLLLRSLVRLDWSIRLCSDRRCFHWWKAYS